MGLTPGLERSPGAGNGNPLQYSCLKNPMDRGAWRATVHGVTKGPTQPSTHTHTLVGNMVNFTVCDSFIYNIWHMIKKLQVIEKASMVD